MKKVDDYIIERLLEQCKYIKWINVEDFKELEKSKKTREN